MTAHVDGGKAVFEDDKNHYAWVDLLKRACVRFGLAGVILTSGLGQRASVKNGNSNNGQSAQPPSGVPVSAPIFGERGRSRFLPKPFHHYLNVRVDAVMDGATVGSTFEQFAVWMGCGQRDLQVQFQPFDPARLVV